MKTLKDAIFCLSSTSNVEPKTGSDVEILTGRMEYIRSNNTGLRNNYSKASAQILDRWPFWLVGFEQSSMK
ncbi:MAG TPA: hypothetical protein DIW17_14030, partial [Clostridiales bacterium]|nr:hypothetical protein [Clostridiales bacterium]